LEPQAIQLPSVRTYPLIQALQIPLLAQLAQFVEQLTVPAPAIGLLPNEVNEEPPAAVVPKLVNGLVVDVRDEVPPVVEDIPVLELPELVLDDGRPLIEPKADGIELIPPVLVDVIALEVIPVLVAIHVPPF